MNKTLIAVLTLAVPLALAGCNKDKKDGDADTATDSETDASDDTTTPDTTDDPAGDPEEDAETDVVLDSEDDVTADAEADVTVDSGDDVTADAETDASMDVMDEDAASDVVEEDGVTLACDTDLGDWTPNAEGAGIVTSYSYWALDGAISGDFTTEPVSLIEVESYGTYGGPTTTGTTTLSSFEPYDTCALCITVYEDCNSSTGCSRLYMADQATLELTTIDMSVGGTIEGTLTGMYLVEYDDSSDSLVTDGVSMCVDIWSFSQTMADWS